MTEPTFPEKWCVKSSTSRFFPVHSALSLTPRQRGSNVFELEVDWEGVTKLKPSDQGFTEIEPGTLQGNFGHPKKNPTEQFELMVTLSPPSGLDGKRRLLGLLIPLRAGIEGGGTGVWVAEEQPKDPPQE